MKSLLISLGILAGIFFFNFSNAQNIDTAIYKLDSIIQSVNIQGQDYTLIVLRDKFNEQMIRFEDGNKGTGNWLPEQAPITLMILDPTYGKLLYRKKFENMPNDYPNINWLFVKGQEKKLDQKGKLFFSLDKSYGGSGSINTLYLIDKMDSSFKLIKLSTETGELTDYMVSKNDQELILITGVWNIKDGETHFSNHRYQIKKVVFKNGQVEIINLGTTTNKYPCIDEAFSIHAIVSSIIKRESNFSKKVDIANY